MKFAKINLENICTDIFYYDHNLSSRFYVNVDTIENTDNLIGKKYNWATQRFELSDTDKISEAQLTIMEAIADQYEQNLENRLNDQEVQATIYEAVLALSGGGTTE
jgi:hypothetical protein